MFLISYQAVAANFTVTDFGCKAFDYYHQQKYCLLILSNQDISAGVLVEQKLVMSHVQDLNQLLGQVVSVNLDDLLMLSLEEEEAVREHYNYNGVNYFSANMNEIKFHHHSL